MTLLLLTASFAKSIVAQKSVKGYPGCKAKFVLHSSELPVIASWREFTARGALLSYGPSRVFEAKRLASYVQKVLNGAKPADLPIEQPVKFDLIINLKTAERSASIYRLRCWTVLTS